MFLTYSIYFYIHHWIALIFTTSVTKITRTLNKLLTRYDLHLHLKQCARTGKVPFCVLSVVIMMCRRGGGKPSSSSNMSYL